MSKKKRILPKELRIGDDRFIPIVMRIVSYHDNGMPYELECVPTADDVFELNRHPEKGGVPNAFAIVFGRDVTFPGADT